MQQNRRERDSGWVLDHAGLWQGVMKERTRWAGPLSCQPVRLS